MTTYAVCGTDNALGVYAFAVYGEYESYEEAQLVAADNDGCVMLAAQVQQLIVENERRHRAASLDPTDAITIARAACREAKRQGLVDRYSVATRNPIRGDTLRTTLVLPDGCTRQATGLLDTLDELHRLGLRIEA